MAKSGTTGYANLNNILKTDQTSNQFKDFRNLYIIEPKTQTSNYFHIYLELLQ